MHTLLEIREQPDVLDGLLAREAGAVHRLADAVHGRDLPFAMIVARGTSDNAAVYGKYVLESLVRLPVALAAPSLYTLYNAPPDLSRGLVIAVSQSGRSPDLVAVLREARRQGGLTAAIVNVVDSPLAAAAEHVLWCGAGPERAVAATKSYTAQLLLLAMLAAELRGDPALLRSLTEVPRAAVAALELDAAVQALALEQRAMDRCVVLARGYAYTTALEVALKLKETSYVIADAYSGADFLHGPVAMIDPGFPALFFACAGPTVPSLLEVAALLAERGATTMAVTDDAALAAAVARPLRLPSGLPEALSPISQVLPGQLFAYYLATGKGFDPDQPRGLRKVTETH